MPLTAAARVLVIEDVPDIATLLVIMLRAEGLTPIVARDGREALRAARRRPDLVLLDLLIPPPDGFEVACRLRARYADLPILAVTAISGVEDHARALACGIDEIVTKPFDPDVLLDRIRARLPPAGGRSPGRRRRRPRAVCLA